MAEPFPATGERRIVGIAFMLAAVLIFTGVDTATKYLLGFFPVFIVVWARFAGQLLAYCGVGLMRGNRSFWRTSRPRLQLLRSCLLLLGTTLNFFALVYLPLSITVTILFTYPLLVAAFSPLLIDERLPTSRWLYLLLAFVGVLVIMRPGSDAFQWPMLLSLLCALVIAAYAIATRIVARYDPPLTNAFYSGALGAVVPLWLLAGDWQMPAETLPWVMLLVIGALLASIGHGLFAAAHRHAPAPVLAPYVYTQIVWVTAAGYVVFGDLPDSWTIAGCLIIVAASLRYFHIEWVTLRGAAPRRVDNP